MDPIYEVLHQTGHNGPSDDPVAAFVHRLAQVKSTRRAERLAKDFYRAAALTGHPIRQGDLATFVFHGPRVNRVCVAGDFNGWHGDLERMFRVGQTNLFVLRRPISGHSAYKFVVDGRWKIDPANPRHQEDGHGGRNSLTHPGGPDLVLHPDFYSKPLRNRRPITIYLPPGYDAAQQRYPVVYIMDGRENLDRGRLPWVFEAEIRRGSLPPFIGVFIPNKGRGRNNEYTPYYRQSRIDAYHRFVALELVPFIDRSFRTRTSAEDRVLLGQSYGGTVVTTLAARAPGLFRNVLAQSGVYTTGRRSVLPLFEQHPRPDLRFYLDGVNNRAEQTQNRLLTRTLDALGYPYYYRAVRSRHEYEDWQARIPEGLRFLWHGVTP